MVRPTPEEFKKKIRYVEHFVISDEEFEDELYLYLYFTYEGAAFTMIFEFDEATQETYPLELVHSFDEEDGETNAPYENKFKSCPLCEQKYDLHAECFGLEPVLDELAMRRKKKQLKDGNRLRPGAQDDAWIELFDSNYVAILMELIQY